MTIQNKPEIPKLSDVTAAGLSTGLASAGATHPDNPKIQQGLEARLDVLNAVQDMVGGVENVVSDFTDFLTYLNRGGADATVPSNERQSLWRSGINRFGASFDADNDAQAGASHSNDIVAWGRLVIDLLDRASDLGLVDPPSPQLIASFSHINGRDHNFTADPVFGQDFMREVEDLPAQEDDQNLLVG